MGHFDYKNWIVQVELKDNLTDKQILDYLRRTNHRFTQKEYRLFLEQCKRPLYNSIAEKIILFFVTYDNGKLMPDRYNAFEPVNKVFSLDKIPNVIESLCWPRGCLYLKKLRKFEVSIENYEFAVVFSDGENIFPRKPSYPEYMTTIQFYFDKKRNKDPMVFIKLLHDLCGYLGTNRGFIKDQEDWIKDQKDWNIIYEVANV